MRNCSSESLLKPLLVSQHCAVLFLCMLYLAAANLSLAPQKVWNWASKTTLNFRNHIGGTFCPGPSHWFWLFCPFHSWTCVVARMTSFSRNIYHKEYICEHCTPIAFIVFRERVGVSSRVNLPLLTLTVSPSLGKWVWLTLDALPSHFHMVCATSMFKRNDIS